MNNYFEMAPIDINEIKKDRLDFGFDSIYFRYATIRDELAFLKSMIGRRDYEQERNRAETDKMHFYKTLEQLVHAHEETKGK